MSLEQAIKIGTLVRGMSLGRDATGRDLGQLIPSTWIGIVIGFRGTNPIVHWSEQYPKEEEYINQLDVIS
jgi:hypothetical protein